MSDAKGNKVGGGLRAPFTDAEENAPGGRVPPQDESPGVPGFRTWRGVYAFVLASFVVIVAVLAAFSRLFA